MQTNSSTAVPVSATPDKHRFAMLEGLRGVAAALVAFYHVAVIILGRSFPIRGDLAVLFFFMLSGFVIAYAYGLRLKNGMLLKEFYLRRAIRLYPLLFAGAALGTLFFALYDDHFVLAPGNLAAPIFAAVALPWSAASIGFASRYFPINPPEWTLFYELLAYGVFGLLMSRGTVKRLVAMVIVTFCLYIYVLPNFEGTLWMSSFGAAAAFCIGVLLLRMNYHVKRWRYLPPFFVLATILIITCVLPTTFSPVSDVIAIVVVFPFLIHCGASDGQRSASKMLYFLGELSYPLYILHWPILIFARHFLLNSIGPSGTIAITMAIAIAISWMTLIHFDRPARKWLTERYT